MGTVRCMYGHSEVYAWAQKGVYGHIEVSVWAQ